MFRRNFIMTAMGSLFGGLLTKNVKETSTPTYLCQLDLTESVSTIKWVDAAERLPELGNRPPFFKSRRVLVACPGGFVKIGEQQVWGDSHAWVDMDRFVIHYVTHWAELPLHPTDATKPLETTKYGEIVLDIKKYHYSGEWPPW